MGPQSTSFDVIILGGGIVGCACARECSQAGMHVAIVDRGAVGGGATAAAMGHVVVLDDSPAQLSLTAYSQSLWRHLRPQLPANVEYEIPGTLWIAADDEEMAEIHRKQSTYTAAGLEATTLNAAELASAEPNLRPHLSGALLVPNDAVIYPPAAAAFFLQQAIDAGATLLEGHEAVSACRGSVVFRNGDTFNAQHIVIATGAFTALTPQLKIRRRKGHLVLTDRYPGYVHHQLVELGYLKSAHALDDDSVAFNVQPRQTGQLLIGSSRQFGNEDPAVEQQVIQRMLDRANAYLPGLAKLSTIRSWTGFRAATPDKLPLIGPTDDPTVFLAMGFEGLGITNSPAAARLVLDHLQHRDSAIDSSPFLPSRLSQ